MHFTWIFYVFKKSISFLPICLNHHIDETYSDYKILRDFYLLIKNIILYNITRYDDNLSRDCLKMLSYWYIGILIIQIRQFHGHGIFIMGILRPDKSLYWNGTFYPISTHYSVSSYPRIILSEHLKYDSPGCSHMYLANGLEPRASSQFYWYHNKAKPQDTPLISPNSPCPEPVYTDWSSVHWNATGWPSVHWDTTGQPSEYLQSTLEHHWKNLVETAPHWNATGETLTFAAYTGTPLEGLWQPTHATTQIVKHAE